MFDAMFDTFLNTYMGKMYNKRGKHSRWCIHIYYIDYTYCILYSWKLKKKKQVQENRYVHTINKQYIIQKICLSKKKHLNIFIIIY